MCESAQAAISKYHRLSSLKKRNPYSLGKSEIWTPAQLGFHGGCLLGLQVAGHVFCLALDGKEWMNWVIWCLFLIKRTSTHDKGFTLTVLSSAVHLPKSWSSDGIVLGSGASNLGKGHNLPHSSSSVSYLSFVFPSSFSLPCYLWIPPFSLH
jgi:hypothetical protein